MLVTTLDEGAIADIGHAFGYYDYGEKSGLSSLFPSQEATAAYIRGYARGMLRGGFLHTNSPRQEGFLAFKRPGERLGLPTLGPLAKGLLQSMTLRELVHFAQLMKRAGPGLDDQLKCEKRPSSSWAWSASGRSSRARATCARSWILPFGRGTAWASRWS